MATIFLPKSSAQPSFVALAFQIALHYRNADGRLNVADDCSTSCKNSVNFGSAVLKITPWIKISTFGQQAKIGISTTRMSQNVLNIYQIFRTGIDTCICVEWLTCHSLCDHWYKGRCYKNQLLYETNNEHWLIASLSFAPEFHNVGPFEYRCLNARINGSADWATSRKFGELWSSNSGVYEAQLCTAGVDQHSGYFNNDRVHRAYDFICSFST